MIREKMKQSFLQGNILNPNEPDYQILKKAGLELYKINIEKH